jgi:Spy/CpxP family protein refolding chaperone
MINQNLKRFNRALAVAAFSILLTPLASLADESSMGPPPGAPMSSADHHQNMYAKHKQMMMDEMQRLNLSSDQTQKIQSEMSTFEAAHPANGTMPTHDEMKAHQKAIMSILTPDQREQFKHDMKMQREKMMAHHHKMMMKDGMETPTPNDTENP